MFKKLLEKRQMPQVAYLDNAERWSKDLTRMRAHGEPRGDHPTQKPIGVMKWCIGHVPGPARLILDPFMGSGTTGVAAVEMGRQFIGIERVQRYFDVACRRVADALARPDMFIEKPARAARTEQPVGLFDTTGS